MNPCENAKQLWSDSQARRPRTIRAVSVHHSTGGNAPPAAVWLHQPAGICNPQEVRRLIYTTNAIEGFNRQLRKVTKSKSVFPTDDSLFKMLYLAMMDITKKWTGRRQDWSKIYAQLTIFFSDRMPE